MIIGAYCFRGNGTKRAAPGFELLPVKRTEKKLKVFYTARQVCRAVGTEDLGSLLRQTTQIFGCLGS